MRENFEIHQGLPFESRCQIRVPPGAMHSFQAGHNEVNWKLIVKASVAGWPDYERVFQIVVNPGQWHDGRLIGRTAVNDPRINLTLDDTSRVYQPGELLAGSTRVEGVDVEALRAVELSVLWHTEGKGDEDMSVHFFERIEARRRAARPAPPRRFTPGCPTAP